MANWSAEGYALTAAGRRLQAKVEAGAVLHLTKMKIGNGTETSDETDSLIDLVEPMANVTISSAEVTGETCTVTGTLLVSGLEHGFWAREWGLFATDPDEGEILYMIALDAQPDWIPANAEAGTSITYAMKVAVANGTEIKANVDLTGLVEVEQLEQTTHSLRRLTAYSAGDILNAPNLPHGLVLECITAGTTAETLIDLSSVKCGDTVTDGGVVWKVKKIVTTAYNDNEHDFDWLHDRVKTLGTNTYNLIIPSTGWQENAGSFCYRLTITDANIKSDRPVQIVVAPDSLETAGFCGLSSVITFTEGTLILYAKAEPEADINAEITIFAAKGGGGGGVDLPIATESTLGAVKIGQGLNVKADGTLSIDPEKVLSDTDMVNEEEVIEAVKEILNGDDAVAP